MLADDNMCSSFQMCQAQAHSSTILKIDQLFHTKYLFFAIVYLKFDFLLVQIPYNYGIT